MIFVAVTQAPGFQVVPQKTKTPQPIIPKEGASSRKSQKASHSAGECWPHLQTAIVSPDELNLLKKNQHFFSL